MISAFFAVSIFDESGLLQNTTTYTKRYSSSAAKKLKRESEFLSK